MSSLLSSDRQIQLQQRTDSSALGVSQTQVTLQNNPLGPPPLAALGVPGTVELSTAPADPSRPIAVAETDPRFTTAVSQSDLVALTTGTRPFTALQRFDQGVSFPDVVNQPVVTRPDGTVIMRRANGATSTDLYVAGQFYTGSDVLARTGAAVLGNVGPSNEQGVKFGGTGDAAIYRQAADALNFKVNGVTGMKLKSDTNNNWTFDVIGAPQVGAQIAFNSRNIIALNPHGGGQSGLVVGDGYTSPNYGSGALTMQGPLGRIKFAQNFGTTGLGRIESDVSDGASAVGLISDNLRALSTSGAKLLSLRNAGTEKVYVGYDGAIVMPTGLAPTVIEPQRLRVTYGWFDILDAGNGLNTGGVFMRGNHSGFPDLIIQKNTGFTTDFVQFRGQAGGSGSVVFSVGSAGSLRMIKDQWHTDTDLRGRLLFSGGGDTIFGSQSGYQFRDSLDATIVTISGTGNIANTVGGGIYTGRRTSAANDVMRFGQTGDSGGAHRLAIAGSGLLLWGDGTNAGDAKLYRSSSGFLKVEDHLRAVATIRAHDTTANQVVIGHDGTTDKAGFAFGSSLDTNLYRYQALGLRTNGDFMVRGGAATQVLMGDITGDTVTPAISFGSAGDTTIFRQAADVLATSDDFLLNTNTKKLKGRRSTGNAIIDLIGMNVDTTRIGSGNAGHEFANSGGAVTIKMDNGDIEHPLVGTGIILKSPDGLVRKKITIDNSGALVLTTV